LLKRPTPFYPPCKGNSEYTVSSSKIPCQKRAGPARELSEFGLLQARKVDPYAAVSQHVNLFFKSIGLKNISSGLGLDPSLKI
jgi:hypothetical protein